MPQKDDQPESLSQREARQREIEKEKAEEEAFAALANSPEGRCIMQPYRSR